MSPLPHDRQTSEPAGFSMLATRRLQLREIVQDDIHGIFHGLSHPQVIRYYGMSYATLEATQEQMDWYREQLLERTGVWWGICRPDAPHELLGACGYNDWERSHRRAELGYWLLPQHWRSGIMRESLEAVIAHGFAAMDLHRIEAVVDTDNGASSGLLRRLGFTHEGVRRECELHNGRYLSLDCFGLLRTQWERR
ncbi:GNAT family N-acetyltransferase [Ectopseudomonas mendocina]|uniref:GNAT family N-acetyltransferase n=1 Tax=Ectopseudomonas mendocina TaxID=300 RepID=UPI001AE02ACF|nr:GNAT family protein [Pseudomonas mendocina]QTN46414.1 GNAT family N-acetyltransferase [Pseudomonas mendocina]